MKGICGEIWSYELEQFMFEGIAGMHVTTYEIGIFHAWQPQFKYLPVI